jgi:hypothetical protein
MCARVIAAVAGTAGLLVQPTSAVAASAAQGGGFVDNGTPVAKVRVSVSRDADRGGDAGIRCAYRPLPVGETVLEPDGRRWTVTEGSGWHAQTCFAPTGEEVSYTLTVLGPRVDPAVLAAQALRRLPLPAPAVGTSPPADREQLVNLPTWLWVHDDWAARSATASLPGVSVTVTAQPVRVRWEMGDGEHVTCHGPGRRYDSRVAAAVQTTDCSYTYRRSSAGQPHQRYQVTATMTWHVTWAATGVAGRGDLGEVFRSTTLQLRVVEGQALITDTAGQVRKRAR